jgi:predicted nucleic-acid-binding protein
VKGFDTNVLLRLLIGDDPEQAATVRNLLRSRSEEDRFFVNRIVLCELAWTLGRGYGFQRAQVADAIDQVLKSDDLVIEDYDAVGFALYIYRTSRADFPDCLLGVTNGFLGCERTATFDRKAAELDEFELI